MSAFKADMRVDGGHGTYRFLAPSEVGKSSGISLWSCYELHLESVTIASCDLGVVPLDRKRC